MGSNIVEKGQSRMCATVHPA